MHRCAKIDARPVSLFLALPLQTKLDHQARDFLLYDKPATRIGIATQSATCISLGFMLPSNHPAWRSVSAVSHVGLSACYRRKTRHRSPIDPTRLGLAKAFTTIDVQSRIDRDGRDTYWMIRAPSLRTGTRTLKQGAGALDVCADIRSACSLSKTLLSCALMPGILR